MPYTLFTTSSAHKMFDTFPPQIGKHLTEEAVRLAENPQLGERLTGALRMYHTSHTKFNAVNYRIVYELNEQDQCIIIRAVGTREHLYQHVQKFKLRRGA